MKSSLFLITDSPQGRIEHKDSQDWIETPLHEVWRIHHHKDLRPRLKKDASSSQLGFGFRDEAFQMTFFDNGEVSFQSDEFCTYPVFYLRDESNTWISNSPYQIHANHPRRMDLAAILEFLSFGILVSGRTFYEGIELVDGLYKLSKAAGLEKSLFSKKALGNFHSKEEIRPQDVKEHLQNDLQWILENQPITHFRMSGGLDTRTLGLLGHSLFKQKNIQVQSVQSPYTEPGADLDVELPRMFCEKAGLPFTVLTPEKDRYNYFFDPFDAGILSGLYGGEFLGGQILDEIPLRKEDSVNAFSEAKPYDDLMQVIRQNSHPEQRFQFYSKLSVSSFRSTIYDSFHSSWSAPYKNGHNSTSPFRTSDFIRLCGALGETRLKDYGFYLDFYQSINRQFSEIPLCSMIHLFTDILSKATFGSDPKLARPKLGGSHYLDWLADVKKFFEKREINIDENYWSQASSQKRLGLRLFNLKCWFNYEHELKNASS